MAYCGWQQWCVRVVALGPGEAALQLCSPLQRLPNWDVCSSPGSSSPPLWAAGYPDIDAATAMMLLKASDLPFSFPQGVIQNGARMVSQSSFPNIRALPIRSVLAGCRMRSDSEPSCDSPLVSSDPKEDHNYSSGVKGDADSPSSDPLQGSEASFHGNEAASDTEDDDKSKIKKEPREWSVDAFALAQQKKRQHLPSAKVRGQRLASDTLPLKKRRTEKPPESDDEEMKEAAGSLLHLAGVRACLNNITNRTAKGQKEASKN
ncbi:forkhead box protein N3 [Alosa pseudoharengus]|uniref:forkhead box protein N3 n=1 Tax=Alosa pseudoharengus TaxID=34774 RepID=UPI003F8A35CC